VKDCSPPIFFCLLVHICLCQHCQRVVRTFSESSAGGGYYSFSFILRGLGHKAAAFVDIRDADAHVEAINWKKCANRVALNGELDPVRGSRWPQLT